MLDIYKVCIFIGMYCLTLGIGLFESYRQLKSDGVMVKNTYTVRNLAYSLLGSSVILLGSGMAIYSNL